MQVSLHIIQYLRFCAIIGCQSSADLWDMYLMGWSAGECRGRINHASGAPLPPSAAPANLTKYIIFCQGVVVAKGVR